MRRKFKILTEIFEDADIFKLGRKRTRLHLTHSIGRILIKTGKLIAAGSHDSYIYDELKPFSTLFPKGYHKVNFLIADKKRIAFCRIVFSELEIKEWKKAVYEGVNDVNSKNNMYNYGILSRLGSVVLMDEIGFETIDKEDPIEFSISDLRFKNFGGKLAQKFGACSSSEGVDFNVVFVKAGESNEFYPCYIGFDGEGKPVCFVIDFNELKWEAKGVELVF